MIEGLELRSFYKKAMRDFLPEEILRKKKHGFGLPFGVWLKTHARLGELIYGLLSSLKSRHIVKPQFLDTLIAEARDGHPGYYGYAIWDLSMLEAWLQTHAAAAAAPATASATPSQRFAR
jgi:asparagine synthase (glutamine-hydrolysing)